MVCIDASDSSGGSTGFDVNGDGGKGGERDTILATEVEAVRDLLAHLDPDRVRIGLVTYAGDTDPFRSNAKVQSPLTGEFIEVEEQLGRVLEEGPGGFSDLASGIRVGLRELVGRRHPNRVEGTARTKVILLLGDGHPTLPKPLSGRENARRAYAEAERARKHGVRIDTYAVGPWVGEPLAPGVSISGRDVMREIARRTGGIATVVPTGRVELSAPFGARLDSPTSEKGGPW